jgi:hypothetical protein
LQKYLTAFIALLMANRLAYLKGRYQQPEVPLQQQPQQPTQRLDTPNGNQT